MDLNDISQGDRREIHVLDYWRVIWGGKWTIAAVLMVVAATVAVVTFMQTPVYRATARVEVSPRSQSMAPGSDFTQLGAGWGWMAEERYLNTQLEILQSRDIARRVMEDLGLDQDPAFARLGDPIAAFASMIEAEALPDTNIIEISMEGTSPVAVQQYVNSLAATYVNRNVEQAVESTTRTMDELLRQVEPIRKAIRENEQQLLELARQSGLFAVDRETDSMSERISQLQKEYTSIQIKRSNLEAVFQEISRVEREGGDYQTIPDVASDAQIQALNDQENQLENELESLSVTFLEKHPKIIQAQSQLEEVRRDITAQADKLISKIKTEYSVALQNEDSLEKRLLRAREDSLDLTVASTDYKILRSEIEEDRRIYDLILSRIKEIDLNKDTLSNNLRLLDEAVTPEVPVRPRKAINLIAGCLLGLMLGTGTVIFLDYLDNTVKSPDDVERYLDLHILAVVPRQRKDNAPAIKEAYQTLRTSLLFSSKARSLKTLLLTSAGPGEGKSSIAVSMAKSLASSGDRVVLVDADLRRPTVHSKSGVERAGGLTNYLLSTEGNQSWLRYLKDVPNAPRLKIITCGPIPPNPPELFSTEKFRDLLHQLAASFDWVLIDSPPLASMSDSLVLGSLVDMVAIVIKHNENDRDLIKRSLAGLRKVDANVIGAVLNSVDLNKGSGKDYYYGGYYYNYGRDHEVSAEDAEIKVGTGEPA
jgi:succinoglycan biosynthesis transport protein ExoP